MTVPSHGTYVTAAKVLALLGEMKTRQMQAKIFSHVLCTLLQQYMKTWQACARQILYLVFFLNFVDENETRLFHLDLCDFLHSRSLDSDSDSVY